MRRILTAFFVFFVGAGVAEAQSFLGSRGSLREQNRQADRENLTRLQTDAQLARFKQAGLLVPLPGNAHIRIDTRLDEKWRWCRPWTREFLLDFGVAHHQKFRTALQVNSAVRTSARQRQLERSNPNAARAAGELGSSHLTGSTVDITKLGMSAEEIQWMRNRLRDLQRRGLIRVVEEFNQSVFHVMVFKHYAKPPAVKTPPAKKKSSRRPAKKQRRAPLFLNLQKLKHLDYFSFLW